MLSIAPLLVNNLTTNMAKEQKACSPRWPRKGDSATSKKFIEWAKEQGIVQ
jgi:hypothetical protein